MKLMGRLLFALICITTSGYLYAQDKIGEICKWDFDKDCAVALTFDDWLTTHPTIVVPALQERGMTATFYVITKDLNQNTIKQINSAAELGNEIGNHTITHPSSDVNIAKEARPAKEQLDAASNIAEGAAKPSDVEFAHFLDTSLGSSFEVETQLLISKNVGYISQDIYEDLLRDLTEIERQINGLIGSIRED